MQEGDARKTRRWRGAVHSSWAMRFIARRGLPIKILTDQDVFVVHLGALLLHSPQRSRERTHFRSSELTQQVRIDLWSVGQTSRYPTCLQATIPLFDCGNHSSAPTWIPRDMASAGGQ
jgi:hypothetical protein